MGAMDINAYFPNEHEEYMGERQVQFFRHRLQEWRKELVLASEVFMNVLKETSLRSSDEIDAGAARSDLAMDVEARKRKQQLIEQIDHALKRIEEGEYGFCEITGEEIGIRRLTARPVATLCVEVQERYERLVRDHGGMCSPAD